MISSYAIGAELILNPSRVLGPVGEIIAGFEKLLKAQKNSQAALNEFGSGLGAARRATDGLAAAWENVAKQTRAAAEAARAAATATERAARNASTAGAGLGGGGAAAPSAPTGGPRAMPPLMFLGAPAGSNVVPFSGGGGGGMTGGGRGGAIGPAGAYSPFAPAPLMLGAPGGGGMPPLNLPPGGPQFSNVPALSMSRAFMAIQVTEMVVGGLVRLIDKAKGFNDQMIILEQRGVTPQGANELADMAFGISQTVPGTNLGQIEIHAGNLRSVLGESPGQDKLEIVKKVLPRLEVMAAALASVTGETGESSMHFLLRSVEMMGGGINPETGKIDPERLMASMDAAYKALKVVAPIGKANDLFQLMKQGSSVAKTMEPEAFFKMVLAPILDMGGSRTGTALQALGRQFFGGIMTQKVADELTKLHILAPGDFEHIRGGVKLTDAGVGDIAEKMKGGFFEFVDKVVRPKLIEGGFVTEEQQNKEIYRIGSTDTGRRLISLFLTQADQVLKEQKLYDKMPNAPADLERARRESIGFNLEAMETSFLNFLQVAEKVNAGNIIAVFHAASSLFDWLSSLKEGEAKMNEDAGKKLSGPGAFWHFSPLDHRFWFDRPGDNDNAAPPADRSNAPHGGHAPMNPWAPGYRSPMEGGAEHSALTVPDVHVAMTNKIYLDGKLIASSVADHMVRDLIAPPTGAARFDERTVPTHGGALA